MKKKVKPLTIVNVEVHDTMPRLGLRLTEKNITEIFYKLNELIAAYNRKRK